MVWLLSSRLREPGRPARPGRSLPVLSWYRREAGLVWLLSSRLREPGRPTRPGRSLPVLFWYRRGAGLVWFLPPDYEDQEGQPAHADPYLPYTGTGEGRVWFGSSPPVKIARQILTCPFLVKARGGWVWLLSSRLKEPGRPARPGRSLPALF